MGMKVGFQIEPLRGVVCMNCDRLAAASLDDLPRCGRCGQTFCPHCLANCDPSATCGMPGANCPMGLPFLSAPSAFP